MVGVVLVRSVWTHAADAVAVGKDGGRDVYRFVARLVQTAAALVGFISEGAGSARTTLSVCCGRVRFGNARACIAVGHRAALPVVTTWCNGSSARSWSL